MFKRNSSTTGYTEASRVLAVDVNVYMSGIIHLCRVGEEYETAISLDLIVDLSTGSVPDGIVPRYDLELFLKPFPSSFGKEFK